MTDSGVLKLERAAKHVNELNELFGKTRPFIYIIETDTDTGERSATVKKDEAAANAAGLMIGDAIHNIRSALDHAYYEIVVEKVRWAHIARTGERLFFPLPEERKIQFPFTETAKRLESAIENTQAYLVGEAFVCALRRLQPYGEKGGNQLLYLIHKLDLIDKHMLLVPVGNYTKRGLTTMLRDAIPDFPYGLDNTAWGDIGFKWKMRGDLPLDHLGAPVPGTTNKFQREIRIPIDIIFEITLRVPLDPIIPLLHKLIDTARETIEVIRQAAR